MEDPSPDSGPPSPDICSNGHLTAGLQVGTISPIRPRRLRGNAMAVDPKRAGLLSIVAALLTPS
jgi:hypothetical protein